jgi:hypothetical protein
MPNTYYTCTGCGARFMFRYHEIRHRMYEHANKLGGATKQAAYEASRRNWRRENIPLGAWRGDNNG